MNFPNGKTNTNNNVKKLKITDKEKKWKANMANKGMPLEEMINNSNLYYLNNEIAVIHKKPIPIQIVKVDYPSRNKAVITEAYYRNQSTTDYNGVYKGYYIDFDAKECSSKTSFTLSNIHIHQAKHLLQIQKQKGIGFFLIYFKKYNEYYLLTINQYMTYYKNALTDGRKSIPYEFFQQNCIQVFEKYKPQIDYLKGIDILIKNLQF